MAKWIAVNKKDYEHASRTVEQIEYPFRHVIEELEAKCQKYKSYLQAIHSTVMIGGGIECQNALIQVLIEQKADATKWRNDKQSTAYASAVERQDTKLGTMVRKMPCGFCLSHAETGYILYDMRRGSSDHCETPEEAFERGPAE